MGECVDRPGQMTLEDARHLAAKQFPFASIKYIREVDRLRAGGARISDVRVIKGVSQYSPPTPWQRFSTWLRKFTP